MKNSNQLRQRQRRQVAVEVVNAPTLANEWPIARDRHIAPRSECSVCGMACVCGAQWTLRLAGWEPWWLPRCVSTSRRDHCGTTSIWSIDRAAVQKPDTGAQPSAVTLLICIAFMTRQSHIRIRIRGRGRVCDRLRVRGHGHQLCTWRQPKLRKSSSVWLFVC